MRVLPPWLNVSNETTGVPKSPTSRRRSRLRGTEVRRKSTIRVAPCWRMSMPVVLSERSTMIRPSPLRPRRKSTSRTLCCTSVGRASAKRCTWVVCASPTAPAWSSSVTSTVLPSTCVSKFCARFRLNTTRVRLPAWMTLRLRSDPSSIARCAAPRLFAVSRKSSAIRGGLAMANPAGGLAGADLRVNFTTVRPEEPLATLTASMLFALAGAWACTMPAKPSNASATRNSVLSGAQDAPRRSPETSCQTNGIIIFAPVLCLAEGAAACWTARSSPRRRPGSAPSI